MNKAVVQMSKELCVSHFIYRFFVSCLSYIASHVWMMVNDELVRKS
jgi:hypothetical protein